MPTLLVLNGFRFFFYSNENKEPVHVHVEKGDAIGKVWLEPLTVHYFKGFTTREEREILSIVENYRTEFINKWNEYFA
jgi:hypothetical protein